MVVHGEYYPSMAMSSERPAEEHLVRELILTAKMREWYLIPGIRCLTVRSFAFLTYDPVIVGSWWQLLA